MVYQTRKEVVGALLRNFFENKDYFRPKSRAMFSATLFLVFILYEAFMVQVLRARETRATEMPHATQFEHCKPRPIVMR